MYNSKQIQNMWKEIANNSRKNEMTINFSIRTYYDWRKEPIEVIRCIERCRAAYIFNDPKVNFLYGAEFNNGKESKGICSEQRWNNLKQDLRSGKINIIYICKDGAKNEYVYPFAMTFLIDKPLNNFSNTLNEICFHISPSVIANITIEEIKNWFKEIFIIFNGVYGYIDYTYGSTVPLIIKTSSYEEYNKVEINQIREQAIKMSAGYFWGNILTAGHIEALGGERKFKKEVPHYLLEKLPMKDEKMAYYIQLDEDIFSFNEEKYLELKDYFKPILPKENLKYNIYNIEINPDYIIKRKLVYHRDELEKVRKEMEMNGEMQKIRTFLNQPSMTYEEQLAILEERKAKIMGRRQYIEFEIREGADPSHLEITIVFNSINKKQYTQIKKLINGWYFVGVNGGYGGVFTYIHEIWQEKNTLGTWVDMGAAEEPEKALKVLERMLNRYAEENSLWLKKAVIGEYEE